jgi:hypothetical protein
MPEIITTIIVAGNERILFLENIPIQIYVLSATALFREMRNIKFVIPQYGKENPNVILESSARFCVEIVKGGETLMRIENRAPLALNKTPRWIN